MEDGESVVRQYGEMIYNIALHYVAHREDAEDVYSEVFLRYFRGDWKFESEEHRKAWLIRVTINYSKDVLRARREHLELNEEIAATAESHDLEAKMDLHRAVNQLPEQYKEVIVLHYIRDIPVKEIALALEINENTIKTRLKTAREMLKKMLQED